LPRNGTEALLHAHSDVEHALHLFCLNRGVVITPFHNMMLVCPQTGPEHITRLLDVLDTGMSELSGTAAARSTTN
jgi:glutamate-1-semialdehyde 2,1-aminomutase